MRIYITSSFTFDASVMYITCPDARSERNLKIFTSLKNGRGLNFKPQVSLAPRKAAKQPFLGATSTNGLKSGFLAG